MRLPTSDSGQLGDRRSLTDEGYKLTTEIFAVTKILEHKMEHPQILDVGSGDALTYRYLASSFCFPERYVALDARAFPVGGPKNLVRVQGDVLDIVKLPGKFDIAVCTEVLEHIPQDIGYKLIDAIRDKLKIGGRLIITTPEQTEKLDHEHERKMHGHVFFWKRKQLEAAITRSGFNILQSEAGKYLQSKYDIRHVRKHIVGGLEVVKYMIRNYGNVLTGYLLAGFCYPDAGSIKIVAKKI